MSVSVPMWLILGSLVLVAWRFLGLRAWHAAVCLLLGFFLAATAAAPEIRHVVTAVVRSLAS